MLIVEAAIGPSPVAGIGLFAKQFIPKDAVVWVLHTGFDMVYTKGTRPPRPCTLPPSFRAYSENVHFSSQYSPIFSAWGWRPLGLGPAHFPSEQLDKLPAVTRAPLDVYKYKSDVTGKYVVCMDSARHFNHSWNPNTASPYSIKVCSFLCLFRPPSFSSSSSLFFAPSLRLFPERARARLLIPSQELNPTQRAQLTEEQWAMCDPDEKIVIATRDIQIGEEITCNYEEDFPDEGEPTHAFLDEIRHLKEASK